MIFTQESNLLCVFKMLSEKEKTYYTELLHPQCEYMALNC